MISLLILANATVAILVLTATGIGAAANWLGAKHNVYVKSLSVVILFWLVGFVSEMMLLSVAPINAQHVARMIIGIVALAIIPIAFRLTFRMNWKRTGGLTVTYFVIAAMSIGIQFVMRAYLVEAFVLSTSSMTPTIEPGDRFVVDKLRGLHRWDIVAYRVQVPERAVYCKRLIGLPGERLRFTNGNLFINDEPQSAPTVIAGHLTMTNIPSVRYTDDQNTQLGPDEMFVVGDNIEHSNDSRFLGPSKLSDFVGVAECRYWPLNRIGMLH